MSVHGVSPSEPSPYTTRVDSISGTKQKDTSLKTELSNKISFVGQAAIIQNESTDSIKKLGKQVSIGEVKKRKHTVPLSKTPPAPLNGTNDPSSVENQAKFEAFCQAQNRFVPDLEEALRAAYETIDYVSFEDFKANLNQVTTHLNNTIPPGEDYIVVVEQKKSNKWVAELAVPNLDTQPAEVTDLDNLPSVLQNNPHIQRVVMFDDASYSGEQLSRFIGEEVAPALAEQQTDQFTIHIAAPYLTNRAESKLSSVLNHDPTLSSKGRIDIAPHTIMRSAAEVIPEEHHEALTRNYFPNMLNPSLAKVLWIVQDPDVFEFLKKNDFPKMDLLVQFKKNWKDELNDTSYSLGDLIDILGEIEGKTATSIAESLEDFIMSKQDEETEEIKQDFKEFFVFDKGLLSRSNTVFDHKVADHLSVLPCYEKGELYENGFGILANDQPLKAPLFGNTTPLYKSDYV